MPTPENPYQPPKTQLPSTNKKAPWVSFTKLNIAVATTLPIVALLASLWADYQSDQVVQRLGRYATYDREHHFNPIGGAILLFLIFAIPNIVLLALKLSTRKHA